jgi:hypothetical protein
MPVNEEGAPRPIMTRCRSWRTRLTPSEALLSCSPAGIGASVIVGVTPALTVVEKVKLSTIVGGAFA